jgi:hypothetical protein
MYYALSVLPPALSDLQSETVYNLLYTLTEVKAMNQKLGIDGNLLLKVV